MLIIVCDDVLNKALKKSDNDYALAVETLRRLAWSIRRNHHLVYFPTLSLKTLEQFRDCLNENEIAAIRHSFSKKNDLLQIRNLLQFSVEVTFNDVTRRSGNTLIINPKIDIHFDLSEECHLLTENLWDAAFYRYFAHIFQKKNRIDECVFKVNYYSLQGGGVTIKQVYLYECELGQHLCLAVLDSDKKWPNFKGFGPTARVFEEEYQEYVAKNGAPFACHYYIMTNTNEIENLIPLDILRVFSSSVQRDFINKYQAVLSWFDIKKGLEYRLLFDEEDAFKEWSAVFSSNLDWGKLKSIKLSSLNARDFLSKVEKEGFRPIVQPWGAGILESVLNPEIKNQNKFDLKKVELSRLTPNQQAEWNEIGRLVFNWCCCFSKKVY